MKIRNDLAKGVIEQFISETFSKFDFNATNVMNSIIVKMFIHNHFDEFSKAMSKDGYIDIEALEEYALKDIEKLGKFEIPAMGTKYIFDSDDAKKLILKLKEKAE